MRCSILLAVILMVGCTTASEVTLAPASVRPQRAKDIRLARVEFDRVPMMKAVESIRAEIARVYGKPIFSYGITAGGFPAAPEGQVTLHRRDISLEHALTEFCRQTGWQYEWVNIGMVEFKTGPVSGYQPEIRRPKT